MAFKSEIERLVGDVLLLTGFLSYTGPFNQEFRTLLQTLWYNELVNCKIPVTAKLNITKNLVDTPTVSNISYPLSLLWRFAMRCKLYMCGIRFTITYSRLDCDMGLCTECIRCWGFEYIPVFIFRLKKIHNVTTKSAISHFWFMKRSFSLCEFASPWRLVMGCIQCVSDM